MRSADFWNYFDRIARPKLARRADGFSKIFSYLDRLDRPVVIVETGCVREKDAWDRVGSSTVLFDKYCEFHPGSVLFSVDIDPAATALCRSLVGPEVRIHTGDSVGFLKQFSDDPPIGLKFIDLLYLDLYGLDWHDAMPAAIHSLKELLAIAPLISAETLVAVDDLPLSFLGLGNSEGSIRPIEPPRPRGRGRLIGEYARQVGAELSIAEYPSGWLGLGRSAATSSQSLGEARPGAAEALRQAARRPRIEALDFVLRLTDAMPRADRAALAFRLLNQEAEEITFRRDGTLWTAFPWDHFIAGPLFVDGTFQEPEVRVVLSWMRRHRRFTAPCDVIIDVGANIGTSTIPFAGQTACRVVAVEPVPEIFALLCRNVTDNGLAPRVVCVQAAISRAVSGRVRMVSPLGNSGGGEVVRSDREPSFAGSYPIHGTVEVPAMALDELLDAHGIAPNRVAFVWSDTQGCETEVIETGRSLWAAGVPLFAEFDPTVWGGSNGAATLIAAAAACFAGFIPSQSLIADAGTVPQPIAELAAFSRTIGPEGTDVLLLPDTFDL